MFRKFHWRKIDEDSELTLQCKQPKLTLMCRSIVFLYLPCLSGSWKDCSIIYRCTKHSLSLHVGLACVRAAETPRDHK